jgi:hypothetical protein
MTKQRLEKEFTDEEMESIAQDFRIGVQEEPDENEEVFPNNARQLRDYILTLEENIKHKPTDALREELRVYKAHQTGLYKGICFGFEFLIAEKEKKIVIEREDKIANNLYDKKLFAYLENERKVDPERKIHKKELLKETRLTREDLEKAGIQNTGRYLVDDNPKEKLK